MGSNEVVEKEMSEVWWVVLQLYTEKVVNESLLCLLSTLPTNRLEMQLRLKGRILQVMKRSFREDYLVSSEPKPIGMLQARLRVLICLAYVCLKTNDFRSDIKKKTF